MQPIRLIDRLIADNIMDGVVDNYSTDLEAAIKAANKLRELGIVTYRHNSPIDMYSCVVIIGNKTFEEFARTLPYAICLTILVSQNISLGRDGDNFA